MNKQRNIGSWYMSDKKSDNKKWKRRLIEAHIEVEDMFIARKPLMLYSVKGKMPASKFGHIAPGVFFCHPSQVLFDDASVNSMVVNKEFWETCFNGTDISSAFEHLNIMNFDEEIRLDSLSEWSKEHGFHCFKVYEHVPRRLRFKVIAPKQKK